MQVSTIQKSSLAANITSMVQLNSFDNQRFASWKNGYGFGKSSRDYLADPSVVRVGRCSPKEERYYASSSTEKGLWEKGPMFSLGVGDRPDYAKLSPAGQYFASPVTYNPKISACRKDLIYKNLTIKRRFRSFDHIESGPGPARYDTSKPAGINEPSFTINTRHLDSKLFSEAQFLPGPDAYNTRLDPGKTMPMFKLQGRVSHSTRQRGPGPGQYEMKGDFDKFNIIPAGWRPPLQH